MTQDPRDGTWAATVLPSDGRWVPSLQTHREQQLQEHRSVVLDQSCDLESQRTGTPQAIDGEVLWCPNPESGHSIRWALGQVSQQQQPSPHEETAVGTRAAPSAGFSVVAEGCKWPWQWWDFLRCSCFSFPWGKIHLRASLCAELLWTEGGRGGDTGKMLPTLLSGQACSSAPRGSASLL